MRDSLPSRLYTRPIEDPELFIGLVGPIGADLSLVTDVLEEELTALKYSVKKIKLTNIFKDLNIGVDLVEKPIFSRYDSYIEFGNELRKRSQRRDILALLTVAEIVAIRNQEDPLTRTAYIIHQFKRPEEIDLLRRIYGRAFIQISVYSPKYTREEKLTSRFVSAENSSIPEEECHAHAIQLISKDASQEDDEYGQRVRDTFPLADLIIPCNTKDAVRIPLNRFMRAFFSDHFVTPTIDEHGAYFAQAVAFRSSDLSRQVGAVITHSDGAVISVGCNEVPKFGGGAYWEGDEHDLRDFKLGRDMSAVYRKEIVREILNKIRKSGWFNHVRANQDMDALYDEAVSPDGPFFNTEVLDLIEHGRVVHAEMMAITDASRRGVGLAGSTLYCTTFPCHLCAKHIVSSGIERVVYVEPYAKSLAEKLYPDTISIDGKSAGGGEKVKFQQFIGVAPERYREIFRYQDAYYKRKRKRKDGVAEGWLAHNAQPKVYRLVPEYIPIEQAIVTECGDVLNSISTSLFGLRS